MQADPRPWKVENLGPRINSPVADHGVLVTADGERMLFTSRRPDGPNARINKATNEHFENIYESRLVNGRWTEPAMLPPPVNTDGNDATLGLFNDGRTLLIYRDHNGAGDIWQTKRTGDNWSEPIKLGPHINTPHHESSAWFSFDRQWMYFVSDRPDDNVGGQDIYRSRWDPVANDWGPAENLGPDVNSPYDEDGVFVHPDGRTIYFSSKGHNSMGGYDIFRSSLGDDGRWSRPENLGWPINSPDDDLFFMLTADGSMGYFSSIRAGGLGEDDLYSVDFSVAEETGDLVSAAGGAPAEEHAMGSATVLLKGMIKDLHMLSGMEATIELMDLEDAALVASFNSDAATGEYLVAVPGGREYAMYVKADGFVLRSEHISVPEAGRNRQMDMDITLSAMEVGSEVVMKNIFFDTNKADLKSASTAELKQLLELLNSMPTLRLEVSGHTDSVGSRDLNQRLSEQRALSVKRYLVEHGIDAGRLEHKGYGPDKPIAGNDSAEGRAQNRRTEIRIIGR
jgi:outer membrane protein OmpA-like peptidoglycan-associated protein